MVKILASVLAVASAAQLKWTDCGDADTFVTIVGLDPEDIAIPGKTSLTGSGFLSADEAGGQFKFTGKAAGVQVISGGGDLCEDNTITLPDGAGTVQFHALDCPFSAGQIDIKLDLDLTGAVAVNDLINIQLSALSTSGDKLLCMEIETNGVAATDRPDCSGAACSQSCECSYTTCSDEVDACLADDKCAASQDCAFACACNDDACLLKCAASSPSLKALPLAKCITSKCGTDLAATARPDCSGAACSQSCECSYTTCSDEVDACLADDKCAASQDCAFACACNDDACLLKCAASSPSLKALPLAKCITSKCGTVVV